jgi:gliding motility-associated-like protein
VENFSIKKTAQKLFLIVIVLWASQFNVFGQPSASFEYTIHKQCIPAKVSFYNTSQTDSENVQVFWDFGTGTYVLHHKDTVTTYFYQPGVTVRLKVKSITGEDEIVQELSFFNKPYADFVIEDGIGCNEVNAKLISTSKDGDAPIEAWYWDFRDGTIAEGESVEKYYSGEGSYDVLLKVQDRNGCIAYKEQEDKIQVHSTVSAEFSADKTYWCKPVNFTFTSLGETTLPMDYTWYLSDGRTAKGKTASFYINQEGYYDVALMVSNDFGCSDSLMKHDFINLTNVMPSFTMNNGDVIDDGERVCPGEIFFKNTSNGNGDFYWYINDSLVSKEKDLNFDFYHPGPKVIVLQVGTSNCTKTFSKAIEIDSIQARFEIDNAYTCKLPQTLSFTNTSVKSTNYEWEFPDGTIVTDENAQYTVRELSRRKDIYNRDIEIIELPIILRASNLEGCTSTLEKKVGFTFPAARFVPDKKYGCVPLSINFENKSVSDSKITNYEWIVDGESAYSGALGNYTHAFADTGFHFVNLVVTNEFDCVDTANIVVVEAGKSYPLDFGLEKEKVCNRDQVVISNHTQNSHELRPFYITSDGAFPPQVIHNDGLHGEIDTFSVAAQKAGVYSVVVEAYMHGCKSSTMVTDNFEVMGPVAKLSAETSCGNQNTFLFSSPEVENDVFNWDFFGANITGTGDQIYTFGHEGNYQAIVQAENSETSCTDADTLLVFVEKPQSVFITTPDTFACVYHIPSSAYDYFELSGFYSEKAANYCGAEPFVWNFGNENSWKRTQQPYTQYSYQSGADSIVKVQLVVENNLGCTDTMYRHYDVIEPELDFVMDTISGCYPEFPVKFTNLMPDSTVTSWYWVFNGNDSSFNTLMPSHTYKSDIQKHFAPSLTVMDSFGCDRRLVKDVFFVKPDPDFYYDRHSFPVSKIEGACINDSIFLQATPNYTSDSSYWQVDKNGFWGKEIQHVFGQWGSYPLFHQVFYKGCTDSATHEIVIEDAIADFLAYDSIQECNLEVKFLHKMESGTVNTDSSYWIFDKEGRKGAYNNDTAYFTYTRPGIHKPHLIVQTQFGCKDTAFNQVEILRPWANYTVNAHEICAKDTIELSVDTLMYNTTFYWVLENNETSSDLNYKHVFNKGGDFILGIHVENDSIPGCTFDEAIQVKSHESIADFGFVDQDSVFCIAENIVVEDKSINTYLQHWVYQGDTISKEKVPGIANPNVPGIYALYLETENAFHCKDSVSHNFVVQPNPAISIQEVPVFCEGYDSIPVVANITEDVIRIQWSPSDAFLNDTLIRNYISVNNQQWVYAKVKTKEHCTALDSTFIQYLPYPSYERFQKRFDTVIYPGAELELGTWSSNPSTYSWNQYSWVENYTDSITRVFPEKDSTFFTLKIEDACFSYTDSFLVVVKPKPIVSMPNAFMPLGNMENRKVYVRGIGITKLIEFSVYNRWGNRIYRSDDINQGWDGYWQGKVLPQGPYAYQVIVEDYLGHEHRLKGSIVLLH